MSGFHHSVAVLPLLFCRCRSVVPLPFFHSIATVAVAGENGNAGTSFRIHRDEVTRMLIGCPLTAEWQK